MNLDAGVGLMSNASMTSSFSHMCSKWKQCHPLAWSCTFHSS